MICDMLTTLTAEHAETAEERKNSKLQAPNPKPSPIFKNPISQTQILRIWDLGIIWDFGLGT
jgi:hypothetical protein